MIVYASRRGRTVHPRSELQRLGQLPPTSREGVRELLIDFGELESAVAGASAPGHAFRACAVRIARALLGAPSAELPATIGALAEGPLPDSVFTTVPEGYAYYALYPEMYAAAALQFIRDARPASVVVIGIRSIGTSLSAVVAAQLELGGCDVFTATVRPEGHPFARSLKLSEELEREFRARPGAHFLIVDEGPGLSGSSFAAVAEAVSNCGVRDERIVLFPSWIPDGASFLSEAARGRWQRHAKYVGRFEEVVPTEELRDISGGRWRELVCGGELPAVQPQHERRKYLDEKRRVLRKFEGLGRYGKAKLARARMLAAAGFTPAPVALEDGFLITEFVEGRPLARGEADPALIETMARYLAFLRAECAAGEAPRDSLVEMMRVNVEEGLGPEWLAGLDRLAFEGAPAVAIDGRMLPHEWLATSRGYVKTDALDHHDDHFFPGCQDIAWDVAGTAVEFGFPPEALMRLYVRLSGDVTIARRLPFYTAAYLAYRLAYCAMAAGALPPCDDRARFERDRARCASLLKRALARN